MNAKILRAWAVAAAMVLASFEASAIDDGFDPAKYEKGGFAPANDAAYVQECGSCHFAYLPGMLPERSWHALLARADAHFGEALSLAPEAARHIEAYLAANAADHSDYRGSALMLQELSPAATPVRITALPLMRHRHVVIGRLLGRPNVKVKTLTNCDACHENAASGSFAYDRILVPGLSKVVRPGGMF
jgi:hypothetical protein